MLKFQYLIHMSLSVVFNKVKRVYNLNPDIGVQWTIYLYGYVCMFYSFFAFLSCNLFPKSKKVISILYLYLKTNNALTYTHTGYFQ